MLEDLYTRDVVLWSERQAEALRRLRGRAGERASGRAGERASGRAGERANDLDWDNMIKEVESLGRSETGGVRTLLVRGLEHLLRAAAWPDAADAPACLHEAGVSLRDARADWTPSMDRHLDFQRLHGQARRNVLGLAYREGPPDPTPEACPLSLRDPLPRDEAATIDTAALAARLRSG